MENKLLNRIKKELLNNEHNLVNLNGIKCSRADLETMEILLEYKIKHGDFGNFMIYGEIKKVFTKNNLI